MNRAQRRATARTERRSLNHKIAALGSTAVLATAGAGAAVVLTSAPAGANATIVVDSLTDDGTGLTLREAIDQANTDAGQDEITFSVTGTITLASDLPGITDALHIHGPGASSLTIDGDGNYSVFSFQSIDAVEGSNEVTDLTITGGTSGSNADSSGGAIQLYDGDADLLIQDVILTANYSANDGGAIHLYDANGTVTINRATITNNVAASGGGGLYADGDTTLTVVITDSIITGNYAGEDGGGLYLNDLEATITNSVIADNYTLAAGGGIRIGSATATVVSTTIDANTAPNGGGGGVSTVDTGTFALFNSTVSNNEAGYYGGGLYLRSEGSVIVQSTISGNSACQAGGVYAGDSSGAAILLSTITGNTAGGGDGCPGNDPAVHGIQVGGGAGGAAARQARRSHAAGAGSAAEAAKKDVGSADDPVPAGTLQLIGTIVAANGSDPADLDLGDYSDEAVTVESLGSVIGVVEPGTVTVTDAGGTQTGVTAAALKLGPLADNGGPTKTHALVPGSVAIDAGPATAALPDFPGSAYDQRGEPYTRIVNGKVDVGAYEVQVEPTPEPTPEPTFTG